MLRNTLDLIGMTQATLSKLTGKNLATVSRWVNGHSPTPRYAVNIVEMWPQISPSMKLRLAGETKTANCGRRSLAYIREQNSCLATVAKDILRSNPMREYSKAALAEALEADPRVHIGAQMIRKHYMDVLLFELGHCFDLTKQKWQYRRN